MATSIIEDERIRWRRRGEAPGGDCVIYWMQQAQRARSNPALEFAVQQANELHMPLFVIFCVVDDFPDASARHYRFMLEGLADVDAALARRGIRFDAVIGDPTSVLGSVGEHAALLVTDRGYLPIQRAWRDDVEEATRTPLVEVETDAVVPADLVSDKTETAARTIRPKIMRELDRFLVELRTTALDVKSRAGAVASPPLPAGLDARTRIDLDDLDSAVDQLGVPAEPAPVEGWKGGTTEAHRLLADFVEQVLPAYASLRNRFDEEPSSSRLSPYLHYGQISPVEVVRAARAGDAPDDDVAAFVDEVVVRRELAINLVLREPAHDRFAGLPDWAKQTLRDHEDDEREATLTAAQLEAGETPDELWNAIMAEIRERGWVHNQLRMYWGKQILRWTNTPGHAFRTLLELNNRYFLDGRDANSYANVAWCFGRHDQGFAEREVLGKIRPFTDQALRRKGDLDGWLDGR